MYVTKLIKIENSYTRDQGAYSALHSWMKVSKAFRIEPLNINSLGANSIAFSFLDAIASLDLGYELMVVSNRVCLTLSSGIDNNFRGGF